MVQIVLVRFGIESWERVAGGVANGGFGDVVQTGDGNIESYCGTCTNYVRAVGLIEPDAFVVPSHVEDWRWVPHHVAGHQIVHPPGRVSGPYYTPGRWAYVVDPEDQSLNESQTE